MTNVFSIFTTREMYPGKHRYRYTFETELHVSQAVPNLLHSQRRPQTLIFLPHLPSAGLQRDYPAWAMQCRHTSIFKVMTDKTIADRISFIFPLRLIRQICLKSVYRNITCNQMCGHWFSSGKEHTWEYS